MWGCIEKDFVEIKSKIVPSLYVRVYRAIGEVSDATDGSLTIREGVSYKAGDKLGWYEFPHYTWGCIGKTGWRKEKYAVPSLYVRVYRRNCRGCGKLQRSLTIREGVSGLSGSSIDVYSFPHYTWGCITPSDSRKNRGGVPPLYVRVYRWTQNQASGSLRFLTIREGVS